MARQSIPVPESVKELQAQLDHFRSTHPPRTRLPESLWQSAIELARDHGLYLVARSLRLGYMQLKQRLGGRSGVRRRNRSRPKFVELIGRAREHGEQYMVEFESAHGAKMRVQCKTARPPDWTVLLRAWRRGER